jgi:hypothetical protein
LDQEGDYVGDDEEEGHFGWFYWSKVFVPVQVGGEVTEEDVVG